MFFLTSPVSAEWMKSSQWTVNPNLFEVLCSLLGQDPPQPPGPVHALVLSFLPGWFVLWTHPTPLIVTTTCKLPLLQLDYFQEQSVWGSITIIFLCDASRFQNSWTKWRLQTTWKSCHFWNEWFSKAISSGKYFPHNQNYMSNSCFL